VKSNNDLSKEVGTTGNLKGEKMAPENSLVVEMNNSKAFFDKNYEVMI